MSTTKRDREYQRKRQARWAERQAQSRARRQRRWTVAALVAALLVVAGAVWLALGASDDVDTPAGADATPAVSPTVPTLVPGPAATAPAGTFTLPDPAVAEGRTWTGTIRTTAGDVGVSLDGAAAPQAVASFVTLAQDGFFDRTPCHRLTTSGIFVLQCGDPTGTGTGGPGYDFGPIENAPADGVYPAGTIAMARAQSPDSMGSQFFLVYEDTTLPTDGGGYTVFGTITSGLDVVQAVADAGVADGSGDGIPAMTVTIEGVETQ